MPQKHPPARIAVSVVVVMIFLHFVFDPYQGDIAVSKSSEDGMSAQNFS
jgi:hypothetical protein